MGQISLDPKILLNYIYNNGCVYEKSNGNVMNNISTFAIYNGKRSGEKYLQFVEQDLIGTLLVNEFITIDCGNWDLHETYYKFNENYNTKDKKGLLDLVDTLINQIKNKNYKNKYKHLIRQHKLERIINE